MSSPTRIIVDVNGVPITFSDAEPYEVEDDLHLIKDERRMIEEDAQEEREREQKRLRKLDRRKFKK